MPAAAIETDEDTARFLDGIVGAVQSPDFTPELTRWVQNTTGTLGRYMTSGRSPDGTPYRPLKRKRPAGHNQKSGPLIDTGEMLLSLIGEAAGHIEGVSGDEAFIGTGHTKMTDSGAAAVAAIHQFGAPKANIPPRPFIGFNPEIVADAEQLIADGLADRISRL